jgi:hypothetical protein
MNNEQEFEEHEPKGYVFVNGEEISIDKVEVYDIEEDLTGRDLVTFIYNGKNHQSYIILK